MAARADVLASLGSRRTPLTLARLRELTRQLEAGTEPTVPLRLAVLHTYTTELLAPYWRFEAALQGFSLHLYEAPYGALRQEAEPDSGLARANPDLVAVFLRWEDLDPRLGRPLTGQGDDLVEAAVAFVAGVVEALRSVTGASIVVSLLPRLWGPELGLFTPMVARSDMALRQQVKAGIAQALEAPALLFDLDDVVGELGRSGFFDRRLWEISRFPFSVAAAQACVRHLIAYAAVRLLPRAKVIVLDADNTLWGGIVGEEGAAGIALGPDYPGSLYVAFQRRLLELQQRGFLLALCSKNNPDDVAEILASHPHQVLRSDHFAAQRVNWASKPDNLRALAEELNLGLESFVFVDDSAHELLAVQQQLPQVTVVRAPSDPLDLPYCLDGVARLEITSLTDEDRTRTRLYHQERQRQQTARSYPTLDKYLASLNTVMRVGTDAEEHAARIAQLTQKTNQFNLTTRRYSEAEIVSFMRDPDCLVAHFSLADIFGDAGLVGVAVIRGVSAAEANWDTLLMSCRVIGRRAEEAFVHHLLSRLGERGVRVVRAHYLPTAKNQLVRDFWPVVGFAGSAGDYVVELPVKDSPELPIKVEDI